MFDKTGFPNASISNAYNLQQKVVYIVIHATMHIYIYIIFQKCINTIINKNAEPTNMEVKLVFGLSFAIVAFYFASTHPYMGCYLHMDV